jgi:hypothetical protein
MRAPLFAIEQEVSTQMQRNLTQRVRDLRIVGKP